MWAPRRRLPMPTMSVGPVRHETNGRRALRQRRTIAVKESTLGEDRLLAGPFDPPFGDDDPRCGRLEEAHLDLQGGDPVRGGVAGDASVRHCRVDPAGDEPALGHASGVAHLGFAREFEPRPTELAVGFEHLGPPPSAAITSGVGSVSSALDSLSAFIGPVWDAPGRAL